MKPDQYLRHLESDGQARAAAARPMAHETSVHRWDGEAAGDPQPIAPDLAADGIDEYLGFVQRWLAREPVSGLEGFAPPPLHRRRGSGEWSLQLRPDGLELLREHVKADAAIRGAASDLLLWLVNRVPADSASLQVFGQTELVDLWSELRF